MTSQSYPFAQEFITDALGQVRKVILDIADYEKLIEALEAEAEISTRSHDASLNGYAPKDEGLYDNYLTQSKG